jgi:hypothetical protein
MAIPEVQLETWSHQGSVAQSRDTYATIKNALEAEGTGYANKDYNVFLQGSYCNDTNIYRESDVDVVIRLESTFHRDIGRLPVAQQEAYKASYPAATYSAVDFKRDVLAQLRGRFGAATKPGEKAVKIDAEGNRRSGDVIVATEFRRYRRFLTVSNQDYESGICFWTRSGTRIVNYPKQHSRNCTAKHQGTNTFFKPMVRIFKNLRSRLIESEAIEDGGAPSYYIEGLLYNVPDELFGVSYDQTFVKSVNWMLQADRSQFLCANREYYLLRGDENVTWSASKCDTFLNAAVDLWNEW